MSAANLQITIEKGATFEKEVFLKDENQVAINLTGYVCRSSIKKNVDDLTGYAFTVSVVDAAAGKILWSMSADDTAAIDASGSSFTPIRFYYDLEIENPSGFVTRLFQGVCLVVPEVTT